MMTLLAIHVELGYQTSTMHALELGYKLGSGAGRLGPTHNLNLIYKLRLRADPNKTQVH